MPSESVNGHSRESHLHPVYQCPECGTEGLVSIEQILPQILLAIGHALSHPPHADSQPPTMTLRRASSSRGAAPPSPGRRTDLHVNGNGKAHPHPAAPGAPADSPLAPLLDGVLNGWEFGGASVPGGEDVPPAPRPDALHPSLTPDAVPATPTGDHPPRGPQAPRSLDLDFRCPNCGAEGWIPVNRLDRQFQCTACHAKLFTDAGGELHVGDLSHGPRDRAHPEPRRSDPLGSVLNGWKHSLGQTRPPRPCPSGSPDGSESSHNGSRP
jgi:predicted RNA-binding Zn-ribbon protein involved in translation (DUF1610 family)